MNNDHTTGLSQDMAACGVHSLTQPQQIPVPPGLPPPLPPHNLPPTQVNAQHHTFDLRTQLTELLEQEVLDFSEVIQAKLSTDTTYLPSRPISLICYHFACIVYTCKSGQSFA